MNEKFRRLNEMLTPGGSPDNDFGVLMVKVANDYLSKIKRRIQETGIDSKGVKYHDYSAGYLKKKSGKMRKRVYSIDEVTGNKSIKKTKTGKSVKGPFYPDRYKGYTDFSYSNDMWNSTLVQKSESTNTMVVIGARGNDREGVSNYDKMKWNTNEFGPILMPSNQEIEDVNDTFNSDFQILIDFIFQ